MRLLYLLAFAFACAALGKEHRERKSGHSRRVFRRARVASTLVPGLTEDSSPRFSGASSDASARDAGVTAALFATTLVVKTVAAVAGAFTEMHRAKTAHIELVAAEELEE